MILHVAGGDQLEDYNHWILFLGFDRGKAHIADSVDGKYSLPLAQILARWDGNAIFVSNKPIKAAHVQLPEFLIFAQYAGFAFVAIVVVCSGQKYALDRVANYATRISSLWNKSCGFVAISVAGLLIGISIHAIDPSGFIANPDVISFVAAAQIESYVDRLSYDELQRMTKSSEVIFVDARWASDYRAGHIPDAYNVPINTTSVQRRQILQEVNHNQTIIVYCQSPGCRYADIVATGLIRDGYELVVIYPGGWSEWNRHARISKGH
jgi:rhodanese-related sulfurtransferase